MSGKYGTSDGVSILIELGEAMESNRLGKAFQINELELKRARKAVRKGVKGANARLAAAMYWSAFIYGRMDRNIEAEQAALQLIDMIEHHGDSACGVPLSMAQSNLSSALYRQLVYLKNANDTDAAETMANRCIVISEQALADVKVLTIRSKVRMNLAVCYQTLERMAKAEKILFDSLDEAEGEASCVILGNLSELHLRLFASDTRKGLNMKGLAYARRALELAMEGNYKLSQRNALNLCIRYLRVIASDTGDFEEFYSVIEDLCRLCRSLEGGKMYVRSTLLNRNSLAEPCQFLIADDARELRAVAVEKRYISILWALKICGKFKLTDAEDALRITEDSNLGMQCSVCEKVCELMRCGGCTVVKYCSAKCQRADWKEHKQVCKKLRKKDI